METFSNILLFTSILYSYVATTDAILCYQCAETTDDKESAPCINRPYHLMAQKSLFEKGEQIKNLHRLKNCSHYLDSRGEFVYQYCKIERIMAHGVVAAFIRDCSDLRTFGLNTTRVRNFVRADNQTICGYSQLHVGNICVSVCDKDFCNGPDAASSVVGSISLLTTAVLAARYLITRHTCFI